MLGLGEPVGLAEAVALGGLDEPAKMLGLTAAPRLGALRRELARELIGALQPGSIRANESKAAGLLSFNMICWMCFKRIRSSKHSLGEHFKQM